MKKTYKFLSKVLAVDMVFSLLTPGVFEIMNVNASQSPSIYSAYSTSIYLDSYGTPWTFGLNNYGQLGNNSTTNSSTPIQVQGLYGATSATGTGNTTAFLKSDGTVWTTGYNTDGELGNGTVTSSKVPVQAIGLSGITQISGQQQDFAALKSDGTVWTWGYNNTGQLGLGTVDTNSHSTPTKITAFSGATAISSGGSSAMALLSNGGIWTWGSGNGAGATAEAPKQAIGVSGVTAIAAGSESFMALESNGTVWVEGINTAGEFGNGTTSTSVASSPVQVISLPTIVAIAAGYRTNYALDSSGNVWAFGLNGNGQLGNGTTTNSSLPVQVPGLTGVVSISANYNDVIVKKNDGTFWGWGSNSSQQLQPTGTNVLSPVQLLSSFSTVAPPSGVTAIAGNAQVSLSWSPVTGATGYNVYRNGTKINSSILSGTNYTDSTAVNGNSYGYTISSISSTSTETQSSPVTAMPKGSPGILRGIASTTGVTQMTDGDNTTSYTFGNQEVQTINLPSPYNLSGFNAYGNTGISVTFYDNNGNNIGVYTPNATATNSYTSVNLKNIAKVVLKNTTINPLPFYDIDATGTPLQTGPTGLSATSGNASNALSWNAVSGATGYNIYRGGTQPSNLIASNVSGTTYTDSNGLINGNSYTYYVSANTASGETAVGSGATVIPETPPGLLRGLTTTTGVTQLTDGDNSTYSTFSGAGQTQTFNLTSPSNITGFNAYGASTSFAIKFYDSTGTLVATYNPNTSPTNSFTSVNLQNISKVTINNTNASTYNFYEIDATGTPLQAGPTGLSATSGNESNTLSWNSVSGATGYNIYRGGTQPSNLIASNTTGTTYVDSANIVNGNSYTYYVSAITPSGETAVSSGTTVIPNGPAGLLRGLATTSGITLMTDGSNSTYTTFSGAGSVQTFNLTSPSNITGFNAYGASTSFAIKFYDSTGTLVATYNPNTSPTNSFTSVNLQNISKVTINNTNASTYNFYEIDATGTPLQAGPTGFIGSSGDANVTLSWSPVSGATGYNIYRDGAQLSNLSASNIQGTSYTDTSVVNGNHYTYYVSAITPSGETAISTSVTATPEHSPGLLRGLSSTTGISTMTDGDNSTSYTIGSGYASQTINFPSPSAITGFNAYGASALSIRFYDSTNKLVQTSSPNTTATNTITPLSLQNISKIVLYNPDYWNAHIFYEIDAYGNVMPSAPTGFSATSGDTQVSLSWNPVSGATSYNIYRDGVQAADVLASNVTNTSYVDTNLINATPHTYYVSAVTPSGETAVSTSVTAIPEHSAGLLRGISSTTGISTMTDGDNSTSYTIGSGYSSQTINFSSPSVVTGFNAYGASALSVRFYDSGNNLIQSFTPNTTATNTITSASLQNVSKIVLYNPDYWNAHIFYEIDAYGYAMPSAPSGLSATSGDTQVSLSWNSVSGATSYNVYRDGTQVSNLIATNVTDTSYLDTNLINATPHTYYVSANTSSGETAVSSGNTSIPEANGNLLRGLASTGGISTMTDGDNTTSYIAKGSTFLLPNPSFISEINGYTSSSNISIQLYDSANKLVGTYSSNQSPTNTFKTVNLPNIKKIVFTDSDPWNGYTMYELGAIGYVMPSAPTGLTATAGNARVGLNWSSVAGATGYDVYRGGVQPSNLIANNVSGTSYTDTGLTNGTSYTYYVSAITPSGETSACSGVSATPSSSFVPPSSFSASAGNQSVRLNWSNVSGATGYNLYRNGVLVNTSPITLTSYTDLGLANGIIYTYTVTSLSPGESNPSTSVSATPSQGNDYALIFNGTSGISLGTTPAIIGNTPFTVEASISTTSTSYGAVVYQRDSSSTDGQWELGVNGDGTVTFMIWSDTYGATQTTSSTKVNDGKFHKISASMNTSGQIVLYIDGSPAGNASGNPVSMASHIVSIGYDARGNSSYFNGIINDVRIWNTALSQAQIHSNWYNDNLIGNESGLQDYFKFDEGAGTSVYSSTVNGLSASVSSGINWTAVSPPSHPTGLSGLPSSTSISLSWNIQSDAVLYNIYRNGSYLTSTNSTSYTDSSLSASTSYNYTVTAVNANGESSPSSTYLGTTLSGTLDISNLSSVTFSSLTLNSNPQQLLSQFSSPIQINDGTGSGSGWHLLLSASQFTEQTPAGGFAPGTSALKLPLNSLQLSSPQSITQISGTTSTPPSSTIISGQKWTVDSSTPVSILSASSGTGKGTYNVDFGMNCLTLNIDPSQTKVDKINYPAGTPFQSMITWTVVTGP